MARHQRHAALARGQRGQVHPRGQLRLPGVDRAALPGAQRNHRPRRGQLRVVALPSAHRRDEAHLLRGGRVVLGGARENLGAAEIAGRPGHAAQVEALGDHLAEDDRAGPLAIPVPPAMEHQVAAQVLAGAAAAGDVAGVEVERRAPGPAVGQPGRGGADVGEVGRGRRARGQARVGPEAPRREQQAIRRAPPRRIGAPERGQRAGEVGLAQELARRRGARGVAIETRRRLGVAPCVPLAQHDPGARALAVERGQRAHIAGAETGATPRVLEVAQRPARLRGGEQGARERDVEIRIARPLRQGEAQVGDAALEGAAALPGRRGAAARGHGQQQHRGAHAHAGIMAALLARVQERLEIAADGERDGVERGDADRLAGLRVAPPALRPPALGEGAEAGIGEPGVGAVAPDARLHEVVAELGEDTVDDIRDRLLGQPVLGSALAVDEIDELLFRHSIASLRDPRAAGRRMQTLGNSLRACQG
jgi:hypothetical protein